MKASKSLNYLILVKHGLFGDGKLSSNPDLNYEGYQQVKHLAKSLEKILLPDNTPVRIISSSANRCLGSARVLAQMLKVDENDISHYQELWSGYDFPATFNYIDLPKIHDIVTEKSQHAKSIVIVTHQDIIISYSSYFTKREFNRYSFTQKINSGEAIVFHLPEREWRHYPSGRYSYKIAKG